MAESRVEIAGRWRMYKRTETKPDGRKLYYYSFEPVECPQPPNPILPQAEGDVEHSSPSGNEVRSEGLR